MLLQIGTQLSLGPELLLQGKTHATADRDTAVIRTRVTAAR